MALRSGQGNAVLTQVPWVEQRALLLIFPNDELMRLLCFFSMFFLCGFANAQWEVGQTDWLLIDESRDDREIPCSVWYPAVASGSEIEPEMGTFPSFVMAHGFLISSMDYTGLAEALVGAGYVFVSLATEEGFVTSHGDYGLDLAFVANRTAEGDIPGLLSESTNGRVAIGGHSVGGGASWLAAAQNPDIDAVVAMAPAETNVSAIAAGENITVPVLVLSGSADAVTSPSDQHEPIYNAAVNSPCRAFVSIEEGGHCGFADPGTLCDLTEFGFSGLSNAEQLALTLAMAVPWLNYFVRDEPSGLDEMSAMAASSPILSLDLSCAMGIAVQKFPFWQIYPNPSQGAGKIENQSCEILTFRVFNGLGQQVMSDLDIYPSGEIILHFNSGLYVVEARDRQGSVQRQKWFID